MHYLIYLFIMLSVSSCATIEAYTLNQRYYAVKSDYRNLLAIAVAYKKTCDTRKADDDCHSVVETIRIYDSKINLAFTYADIAIKNNDIANANKAIEAGEKTLASLGAVTLREISK